MTSASSLKIHFTRNSTEFNQLDSDLFIFPLGDEDLIILCNVDCFRHDGDEESKDQWVEVISWEPRASVFHNFLVIISLSPKVLALLIYLDGVFRSVIHVTHALVKALKCKSVCSADLNLMVFNAFRVPSSC